MKAFSMFSFHRKDVVFFEDFIDLVDWLPYETIDLIIDDIHISDISFSDMRKIAGNNQLRVSCVLFDIIPDDALLRQKISVYVKRRHKKDALFI